jgi:hypothetical protein
MCRILILLLLAAFAGYAQPLPPAEEEIFFSTLTDTPEAPSNLLSTRTVVFYSPPVTKAELQQMQESFFKTGIDAVAYFETDRYLAGVDSRTAFDSYLSKRDVQNLLFVTKPGPYRFLFVPYRPATLTVPAQIGRTAWKIENTSLAEALLTIYRASSAGQLRTNMLVNEYAETDLTLPNAQITRNEYFAVDLKVDALAVQRTGNEAFDKEIEQLMKERYPFKFTLVDPGLDEAAIRQKGFIYLLYFLHARGTVIQDYLGYKTQERENALVSVGYNNGQPQLKTIPASTHVYKFYVRHMLSGTNYLGPRWDADEHWQDALRNYISGMKVQMEIR